MLKISAKNRSGVRSGGYGFVMNSTALLILAAIVVAFLIFKIAGQVSAGDAQTYLKQGALVIDVRSPGEFASGHLSMALNIPLDVIESVVPERVKDHNQVLLLHCLSGTRSGMAKMKLKSMGYTQVFNLGSIGRARKVLEGGD